ncbi:MAG: hypothetical protein M1825_000008 [Sarcosagium campestre]|nr:MAG: hypothetical protein M1825_000008 [Sarcosagium campestre]
MFLSLQLLYLVAAVISVSPAAAATDYHERLDLRPLPPSSLLASFNFRSNESSSSFEKQNFRYFPRSLGQILQHTNTKELHLRFTLGRWDAESWGARPWHGAREGGTGVELWAWLEAESTEQADARWTILTNALSGLFCASLNFIDSTRTIRPVISFQPEGFHPNSTSSNLHLLHGTLPREPVCTENLTPFLKLLPCKGKAGISSLLDGHKLFDASWQSMAIDVRPLCPTSGDNCILEMDQTVDMVLDIDRSKRHRDNPIPRPIAVEDLICDTTKPYASDSACYPLDYPAEPAWSLGEIFGRNIHGTCPLTDSNGPESEPVCITAPLEREVFSSAGSTAYRYDDTYRRCFKFPETADFDLVLPRQPLTPPLIPPTPPLYAERTFTGHGQECGGVQTLLTNPSTTGAISFVYLESLPWFMKPYLHTLTAKLSSSPSATSSASASPSIIQEILYRPALDRRRPTHLELLLRVPANSTAILTYAFDKAVLRYTEYPPDANRGFDVPPAIIRLVDGDDDFLSTSSSSTVAAQDQRHPVYLRTTSLLLPLPTPDFSMPYNVIILTSTVMALAFGMIFNLLVRRFVGADEVDQWDPKAKVTRLKAKLGAVWARASSHKAAGKME